MAMMHAAASLARRSPDESAAFQQRPPAANFGHAALFTSGVSLAVQPYAAKFVVSLNVADNGVSI
jgi:hypothetical protein